MSKIYQSHRDWKRKYQRGLRRHEFLRKHIKELSETLPEEEIQKLAYEFVLHDCKEEKCDKEPHAPKRRGLKSK